MRAGNTTAAYECYQRAVDISPDVAKRLIEVRRPAALDVINSSALPKKFPCL